MVEILKSFEQVAGRFSPAVLIVPGLTMVALGLPTWLGGMYQRRLAAALVGAAVGVLVGLVFGRPDTPAVLFAAGAGAVLGAILPRLVLAVSLAALGAGIGFGVASTAAAHPVERQGMLLGAETSGNAERRLTPAESLDVVHAFGLDVADCAKAMARGLPPAQWIVIAAVGAGLLALGLLFGRAAGAMTCATLGTTLVFVGLTMLLMFKGSAPIAHVERQGPFYGIVLLGMAAFGTLEQLLLCRPPQKERRAASGKARARQEESKRGWRNR